MILKMIKKHCKKKAASSSSYGRKINPRRTDTKKHQYTEILEQQEKSSIKCLS